MKIELSVFKSRIAKRLFLLFLVVIFFPLLITGLTSYNKVSQLISNEQKESLRRTSQEYGLGIFKRLSNAQRYLDIAANDLIKQAPLSDDKWLLLKGYFDSIVVFRDEKLLLSLLGTGADGRLIQQLKNLKDEKIIIFNSESENEVWLVTKRDNQSQAYTTLARLKPEFAWPDTELGAHESLCIATKASEIIHCTESMPNDEIRSLITQPDTLAMSWKSNDDIDMLASYWALFMDYQFRVPDWYIITNKPASIVHAKLMNFAQSYIPGIVLALLLIVLLSMISIKRYLKPVESLIKGTTALAKNDFSYRIELNTNDEYQDLAESFNGMAGKLDEEFKINIDIAAVDRQILLKASNRECAEQILRSLTHFSHPQNACVFIFDPILKPEDIIFHYNFTEKQHSEIPVNLKLLKKQLHGSLAHQSIHYSASEVQTFFPDTTWPNHSEYYRFYPLVNKNQLMAGLLIGNKEKAHHPRFSEFLTHTAVVFDALQREKKLEHQASYDMLTGLYNRSHFQESVKNALQCSDQGASLLFIDLDRFKNVNDTLGHHIGDLLLIEAAKRIVDNLPKGTAEVSRFGGDEFIIFMSDVDPSALVKLSENLIKNLSRVYRIASYNANISASIGISRFPEDADNFDSLLKCADMAMYEAKNKGRECYEFYSKELSVALDRRTALESYLRVAVENGHLNLVYQPKVDIQNKCISGFEALSRFTHPTEKCLSPEELFSIAEDTGMVMDLGYHVLQTAMAQQVAWSKAGIWQGRMAINISPLQLFDENFIQQLDRAIDSSGANPKHIELELTEGVFIDNFQKATELLTLIRAKGYTIAIDDFGTGYSSFSYISNLPIDNVKIDRSFILQLEKDDRYEGIISSIISMSKHLGLKVTAEGVENPEHLSFMLKHQCDDIQGYIYSKPLEPEAATALLRTPQTEKLFLLTSL